jgi:hypothetical protein
MSNSSDASPRILFVSLTNDVGSSRIVAEFGCRGAICAVMGTPDCLAAASRFNSRTFKLGSRFGTASLQLTARQELEAVARAWSPDRIVPLDEMGSQVLRQLVLGAKVSADLHRVLIASFGDPDHYVTTGSRWRLMQAAVALGIRAPDFGVPTNWASTRNAGRHLGYPLVLKRESTCGGAGVTIVDDESQFLVAYTSAKLKATAKRMVTRAMGVGVPSDPPLMAQAFIPGTASFRAVACVNGQTLAGVSFVCERQHPAKVGASTIVRQIDHAEMDASSAALVAHLGCSGFVGFDYIIDASGDAHLIEMNARPIGSTHLGARFGYDLVGSYLADMRAEAAPRPTPTLAKSQLIALFPREMQRYPQSDAFATGSDVFHDIPLNDPPVIAIHRRNLIASYPDQAETIARILDRATTDEISQTRSPGRADRKRATIAHD